jgi:hypothetical protein
MGSVAFGGSLGRDFRLSTVGGLGVHQVHGSHRSLFYGDGLGSRRGSAPAGGSTRSGSIVCGSRQRLFLRRSSTATIFCTASFLLLARGAIASGDRPSIPHGVHHAQTQSTPACGSELQHEDGFPADAEVGARPGGAAGYAYGPEEVPAKSKEAGMSGKHPSRRGRQVKWQTDRELSTLLGISQSTVARYRTKGWIGSQATPFRREHTWRPEEIGRWIAAVSQAGLYGCGYRGKEDE